MMKVSAHPLMVAVALGLLGPGALAADPSDDQARLHPGEPSAEPRDPYDLDELGRSLEDRSGPTWGRLTLHPSDDAARWIAPDPA
jgi:hypothetical protein